MGKPTHNDYSREIEDQIAAWQAKPGLRAVYRQWYARLAKQLDGPGPIVEVGSGCGNFKKFFPDAIATDLYANGDWIDLRMDARVLPFADASVGHFVLIDCLHHLPRPIDFLRRASQKLKIGGRIVLLEPTATPWARLVWRTCHHEPVDLKADLFSQAGDPEPENPGFTYANMGTAHLLFSGDQKRLEQAVPGLRIVYQHWSDVLVYPLTGGFSYLNLLPSRWTAPCHRWEERCLPPWLRPWLALRMIVALQRTE